MKDGAFLDKTRAQKDTLILDVGNECFLYTLPNIKENWYPVKAIKSQQDFYQELVNIGFENLQNNQDYIQNLIKADLDDTRDLTPYISNYLAQADVFLNAPDSSLFIFKDKFEETEENPALQSSKIDLIQRIINAHCFNGIVDGEKKRAKEGKILIICEDRYVSRHLFKYLSPILTKTSASLDTGSSEDLKLYRDYDILFTTWDVFSRGLPFDNVSTYILPQNTWKVDYLQEQNNLIYENIINNSIIPETLIEVNRIFFEDSLEINKLQASLCTYIREQVQEYYLQQNDHSYTKADFENFKDYAKNLPLVNNYLQELQILSYTDIVRDNLIEKYKNLKGFERACSNIFKNYIIDSFMEKNLIKLSDQELIMGSYLQPVNYAASFGKQDFIPFVNNMFIDKMNLAPYFVEEKFSDINGNFINSNIYSEDFIKKHPIYTAFGVGEITGETKEDFLVNIYNYQEVLIPKNTIYTSEDPSFVEYCKAMKTYAGTNCLLPKEYLKPTEIEKKDEDIRTDTADNSISLEAKVINGLYSIFTTEQDADNLRLENYDFNKFNNIFFVKISDEDDLNTLIEKLGNENINPNYLSAVKQVYLEFRKDSNNFIIPEAYNYFISSQTKSKDIKIYPTVWDKNFFVIFNGNFYYKEGLKLSRKLQVNLVKTLYIQSFREMKDCKFEIIKISKTLNIINLQELLEFFNQTVEKRRLITIVNPNSEGYKMKMTQYSLEELKQREKELKDRIKKFRRQSND